MWKDIRKTGELYEGDCARNTKEGSRKGCTFIFSSQFSSVTSPASLCENFVLSIFVIQESCFRFFVRIENIRSGGRRETENSGCACTQRRATSRVQSEGGLQLNVDQDQNHHVLETAANLYCHVYEAATQAQDGREVGQVEGRFLFSSTGVPTILVCF